MNSNTSNAEKTLLQILAVVCAIVIWAMILHKGYADISALAEQHSGDKFWRALAQYFFGNLGGGKPPDAVNP